ncbi:MAG TPA: hypothetical protein VFU59_08025 [Candidatus Eisenbacteria bacterium]|nr:hypothetical protein [Candidatus Eisenbacteria bacterium]HEU4725231.1 hypothetical protein [Candidatus Eisenbacteria bacterium]
MPGLRNVFERPEVASVRRRDDGLLEVRVTGLACRSICVRRSDAALRALPNVVDVTFTPDPDVFLVKSEGPPPDPPAMARAIHSMVVAPWARRLLAALAERVRARFR